MDKSAESEAYRQLMSGSDKLDEILDNIAKGEYSTPNAVYKVAVTESVALKAFSDLTSLEPLPEEIRSSVERKLTAAIPMHINCLLYTSGTGIISIDEEFNFPENSVNSFLIALNDSGNYTANIITDTDSCA